MDIETNAWAGERLGVKRTLDMWLSSPEGEDRKYYRIDPIANRPSCTDEMTAWVSVWNNSRPDMQMPMKWVDLWMAMRAVSKV